MPERIPEEMLDSMAALNCQKLCQIDTCMFQIACQKICHDQPRLGSDYVSLSPRIYLNRNIHPASAWGGRPHRRFISSVRERELRVVFPRGGSPRLRIFTFPPPWGLPKLCRNFHFSPRELLPKLGPNFHFSPRWGLPKLGIFSLSPRVVRLSQFMLGIYFKTFVPAD